MRLLISATLNKDKESRPDIFTLVRLPSIKKRIIEFIEEYNCKEEVMPFLEYEPIKPKVTPTPNKKDRSASVPKNEASGALPQYVLD